MSGGVTMLASAGGETNAIQSLGHAVLYYMCHPTARPQWCPITLTHGGTTKVLLCGERHRQVAGPDTRFMS